MTKLYAWLCDPHEGEPEQYPLSYVHPILGVMVLYSTRRELIDTPQMRDICRKHAAENGTVVRLVVADITDELDSIGGE